MKPIAYTYLLKFLWRRNKYMVLGGIFFFGFIVFLISATLSKYTGMETDYRELTIKLGKYERDTNAARAINLNFYENSDVLKRFLPDDFDLYTIINVIDNITSRTKFTVESYGLSTQETAEGVQADKKIVLIGSGTFQQFLDFIRQYKFITGQAISIGSVSLNGKSSVISSLTLTLFAFKPKINLATIEVVTPMDKIDRELLSLVKKYTTIPRTLVISPKYESKSNPFE